MKKTEIVFIKIKEWDEGQFQGIGHYLKAVRLSSLLEYRNQPQGVWFPISKYINEHTENIELLFDNGEICDFNSNHPMALITHWRIKPQVNEAGVSEYSKEEAEALNERLKDLEYRIYCLELNTKTFYDKDE